MDIKDLSVGLRVRVPASEKPDGGNHYAYVTEILTGMMGEPLVIVRVPSLGIEKTADPALLQPARKPKTAKSKKSTRTTGPVESRE